MITPDKKELERDIYGKLCPDCQDATDSHARWLNALCIGKLSLKRRDFVDAESSFLAAMQEVENGAASRS